MALFCLFYIMYLAKSYIALLPEKPACPDFHAAILCITNNYSISSESTELVHFYSSGG
jgi:hypothetical protein